MSELVNLIRWDLSNRQESRCAYCGRQRQNLTLEHIHPVCYGGQYDWINLLISCRACNQRKGNQFLDEFLDRCPRYRPHVESILHDSPARLTRNLIVFYMAHPIIQRMAWVQAELQLSDQMCQILSCGLWTYFDRVGELLGIEERLARIAVRDLKAQLQVRTLREVYIKLWQMVTSPTGSPGPNPSDPPDPSLVRPEPVILGPSPSGPNRLVRL